MTANADPQTAPTQPYPISQDARRGGLKASERRFGILLLVPALTAFGLIVLFPFIEALGLSVYDFTIEMSEPEWTGLSNSVAVITDRAVLESFVATMIFVTAALFFSSLLGLGWALILNHPFAGRNVLRGLSLRRRGRDGHGTRRGWPGSARPDRVLCIHHTRTDAVDHASERAASHRAGLTPEDVAQVAALDGITYVKAARSVPCPAFGRMGVCDAPPVSAIPGLACRAGAYRAGAYRARGGSEESP